jgi:hypothetical protein
MKDSPLLPKTDLVRATLEGRKTQTRRPVKGLKVRLRRDVISDPSSFFEPLLLKKGVYKAVIGDAGAVCAIDVRGKMLGLKPGEFDFVCRYSDGTTFLADNGNGKTWRVEPNGSNVWIREAFKTSTLTCDDDGETGDEHTCDPYCKQTHVYYKATPRVGLRAVPDRARMVYLDESTPLTEWHERGWTPSIHMPREYSRLTMLLTSIRLERVNVITETDALAEGVDPLWIDGNGMGGQPAYVQGFARTWAAIYGEESWETGWCWALEWAPLKGGR